MSNDNCPICMEQISFKNKKTLKCQHTFHEKCILKWYQDSKYNKYYDEPYKIGRCPVCRNKSEELFYDDDFEKYNNLTLENKFKIVAKRLVGSLFRK